MIAYAGEGNFIVVYIGVGTEIPLLLQELKSQKILVRRPPQNEHLKGWIRVSLGTENHMKRFLEIFPSALKKAGWRPETYGPPERSSKRGNR
jgi:histidinol-phosphate/aromatic aminotransferase/cobyric acid decarboxylase-like protein